VLFCHCAAGPGVRGTGGLDGEKKRAHNGANVFLTNNRTKTQDERGTTTDTHEARSRQTRRRARAASGRARAVVVHAGRQPRREKSAERTPTGGGCRRHPARRAVRLAATRSAAIQRARRVTRGHPPVVDGPPAAPPAAVDVHCTFPPVWSTSVQDSYEWDPTHHATQQQLQQDAHEQKKHAVARPPAHY